MKKYLMTIAAVKTETMTSKEWTKSVKSDNVPAYAERNFIMVFIAQTVQALNVFPNSTRLQLRESLL